MPQVWWCLETWFVAASISCLNSGGKKGLDNLIGVQQRRSPELQIAFYKENLRRIPVTSSVLLMIEFSRREYYPDLISGQEL